MTVRRSLLVAALLYILIIVGLGTLNGALLALALPLVVYLGAVFLYQPRFPELAFRRSLSDAYVPLNTEVQVTLTVANTGPDLDEIRIADSVPPGLRVVDGSPDALLTLATGEQHELVYTVTGVRGAYRFQTVGVMVHEHLGLFGRRQRYPVHSRLSILPAVPAMRTIPIRPRRTRGYAGPVPSRQAGSGVEFFGVRTYEPGDPRRWINWRLSARHPTEIFVNDFEQERIADVGLILDARDRTNITIENDSLFEYAVEATAALADMFLSDGNRVGLLVYGRGIERTFPGYGKHQRERILRSLARAKTGNSLVFDSLDYLPTRSFPAKSQIVLISPLCEDDPPVLSRMRARGYEVLVVSPDAVHFEERAVPDDELGATALRLARVERGLWMHQLKRLGIPVINWQVELPLDAVVRAGLRRSLHPIGR